MVRSPEFGLLGNAGALRGDDVSLKDVDWLADAAPAHLLQYDVKVIR